MVKFKRLFRDMILLFSGVCLVSSCSNSEDELLSGNGKGKVCLGVYSGTNFSVKTKALNEEEYKNTENYTVQILQNGSIVKEFLKVSEISGPIELNNGSYEIKAFYGKENVFSRNEFYVEGSQIISVQDKLQEVNLKCEPTCAKLKVDFAPEMKTYFDDYQVNFATKTLEGAILPWSKNDVDPWYVLVDKAGEEVVATISLTPNKKYQTKEAKIVKKYTLKPNQGWTLKIAPKYSVSTGNLGIQITIDESTNDQNVEIEVPSEWI